MNVKYAVVWLYRICHSDHQRPFRYKQELYNSSLKIAQDNTFRILQARIFLRTSLQELQLAIMKLHPHITLSFKLIENSAYMLLRNFQKIVVDDLHI